MSKYFNNRFFTAVDNGAGGAVDETAKTAPVKLTSELLTKLEGEAGELAVAWQKEKYGTPEFNAAKMAMLNKEKEISAEHANLAKIASEAKVAELRQARVQIRETYKAAVLANTGKGANADTAAAEKAAETELDNLLLPTAKVAAVPKEGAKSAGDTTATIESELRSRIEGGMEASAAVKQVIDLGFARGTVGSVRTKFWPVAK